jgi:hypothetical protein
VSLCPRGGRLRELRAPGLPTFRAPNSIPGLHERSAGGTTRLSGVNSGRAAPQTGRSPALAVSVREGRRIRIEKGGGWASNGAARRRDPCIQYRKGRD